MGQQCVVFNIGALGICLHDLGHRVGSQESVGIFSVLMRDWSPCQLPHSSDLQHQYLISVFYSFPVPLLSWALPFAPVRREKHLVSYLMPPDGFYSRGNWEARWGSPWHPPRWGMMFLPFAVSGIPSKGKISMKIPQLYPAFLSSSLQPQVLLLRICACPLR